MDNQLSLLQTEKEDLLHQLDEESLRQDKVIGYKALGTALPGKTTEAKVMDC